VHPWLYVDGNPAGIKAALEMIGICSKEVRLPLVPATKKTMEGLWDEVKKIIKSPQLV
jgi:4-hydroxy-tetrahydrodipicolinate synthase